MYTLVFQPCDVSSRQLMSCLTPEVVVPEAFQGWDLGLISAENRTRRRRSQERFEHSSPHKQKAILHDENHLARRYPRSVEQDQKLKSIQVQQEADQTFKAEDEILDFYLGFKLDGVRSYTNLSDTKDMVDYAKFTYFSEEPEIPVAGFEPFVLYSGMRIQIKVNLVFSSLLMYK